MAPDINLASVNLDEIEGLLRERRREKQIQAERESAERVLASEEAEAKSFTFHYGVAGEARRQARQQLSQEGWEAYTRVSGEAAHAEKEFLRRQAIERAAFRDEWQKKIGAVTQAQALKEERLLQEQQAGFEKTWTGERRELQEAHRRRGLEAAQVPPKKAAEVLSRTESRPR